MKEKEKNLFINKKLKNVDFICILEANSVIQVKKCIIYSDMFLLCVLSFILLVKFLGFNAFPTQGKYLI